MADCPTHQLLGYLLGALDDDERAAVERELQQDSDLRQQLIALRQRVRPLGAVPCEREPPAGLARRTLHYIFAYSESHPETLPAAAQRKAHECLPPVPAGAGVARGRGRWTDFSMVAGLCTAAALLIFPALENSRLRAQLTACQNNLRQLGVHLAQYSERHNNSFPQVPRDGPLAVAGVYAPILADEGFLADARWVLCPASPQAAQRQFRIPTLQEVRSSTGTRLVGLRKTMGGSYGYTLGHLENGRYVGPRNYARPRFALMADAPSTQLPGLQSLNHAGRGQNVLYEDLHVGFLPSSRPAGFDDDVFLNDTGLVAAGLHRDDAVIGDSSTSLEEGVGSRE